MVRLVWLLAAAASGADFESVRSAARRFEQTYPSGFRQLDTPELERLKREALAWFEAELARTGDPVAAATRLNRQIPRITAPRSSDPDKNLFQANVGTVSPVRASRFRVSPDHAVVVIGVGIVCGYDESVFVYRKADRWSRVLAIEATESPGRPYLPRYYQHLLLSPTDESGRRLFAADSFHPWCTSNFSRYTVLAFQLSEVRAEEFAFLTFSSWGRISKLKVDNRGLLAEYYDTEGDRHPRIPLHLRFYQGYFERVEPIAHYVEDFVAEWTQTPWPEAARWSHVTDLEELARAHRERHEERFYRRIASLHGCTQPDLFQVGARFEQTDAMKDRVSYWRYYIVRQLAAESFRMEEVRTQTLPGCRRELEFRSRADPGIPMPQ